MQVLHTARAMCVMHGVCLKGEQTHCQYIGAMLCIVDVYTHLPRVYRVHNLDGWLRHAGIQQGYMTLGAYS